LSTIFDKIIDRTHHLRNTQKRKNEKKFTEKRKTDPRPFLNFNPHRCDKGWIAQYVKTNHEADTAALAIIGALLGSSGSAAWWC
jgi:hypothetical protein